MHYWLMKTEPSCWSWDNQKASETGWDGVRNYQASNNMKAMGLGDLAFFYHSVTEKRIMGIVQVSKLYHPDPTDPAGRFGMVSVKAFKDLPQPVTLEQIKAHPMLQDLALIRQSRLSVMPIQEDAWNIICQMGGLS
jgi:predicted RNA-binding protein with PUA-like domain